MLPVAKTEGTFRMGGGLPVLPLCLLHPSIPFPPISPPQTVQTGLGQVPGNKSWPTLLARPELEDKLPNTGWDQIETERGMHCWREEKKEGEVWFH